MENSFVAELFKNLLWTWVHVKSKELQGRFSVTFKPP